MKKASEVCDWRRIVLDLRDLTLVNRDAVTFLERSETNRIKLENCPAYIREWMGEKEQAGNDRQMPDAFGVLAMTLNVLSFPT